MCNGVSLSVPGRGRWLRISRNSVTTEKALTQNCLTTCPLFTALCLMVSCNRLSHPPTSLIFSWRWYLRWCLGPFWGVTQCSWVSPCIQQVYMLLNLHFSPVDLSLIYRVGRGCCLSQETRRVKGTLFFLSHTLATYYETCWDTRLAWEPADGTLENRQKLAEVRILPNVSSPGPHSSAQSREG